MKPRLSSQKVEVRKSGSWTVFWIWFITGIGILIAMLYWLFKLRKVRVYK